MKSQNRRTWAELILLILISAAIYLPFINQFGYYYDDWYSMYAARVAGSEIFHETYAIDRPGRAYVMIPLYELFDGNPLYYSISAYVLRLLGTVILLWLLRLIWRERQDETFLIGFLFLIYPGFLSMPNAIDFQSHLIAICLVFLSMGMSVLAFYKSDFRTRLLLWLGAILTGWGYLSQMEYYLGFETARVFLLGVLIWRNHTDWKPRILKLLYAWLPYSIIPGFYLAWRVFFFDNERAQTDVGLQVNALLGAPIATIYNWIGNYIQSVLNVIFLAWGVPLSQLAFTLDTSNKIRGITLAVGVALVSLLAIRYLYRGGNSNKDSSLSWRAEMMLVGILWVVGGLILVVLANRSVTFPVYARYGFVSAPGGIILLVALLSYLSEKRIQTMVVGILIFSAGFTHYANGAIFARQTMDAREFWWQVSWRIPHLERGTTLVTNYPYRISESRDVWGPANHIYYPTRLNPEKILIGVNAILLNHDSVVRILLQEGQLYNKVVIVETYPNYRNILVLSKPTANSCVQVIDGTQPQYSRYENDSIMLVGQYSEIEHILVDEPPHTPPTFLFGSEPSHGWCYYYQKADLARQRGEWGQVLEMGEQAFGQGFEPRDPIEWIPFLQAYALDGNTIRLTELAPKAASDPYIRQQICWIIGAMPEISSEVAETISTLYCLE